MDNNFTCSICFDTAISKNIQCNYNCENNGSSICVDCYNDYYDYCLNNFMNKTIKIRQLIK